MHHTDYLKITGVSVAFYFCISLLLPVLAPYIKGLGVNDAQLSWLFAVFPLVMIFASGLIGKLSDQVGRNTIIIAGILCQILAVALYLFGNSPALIVVARMLDATSAAAVALIAIAKIEDTLNDRNRGRMAGFALSLNHLAALLAPLIGGYLADRFFIQTPFVVSLALLGVLSVFLVAQDHFHMPVMRGRSLNIFKEMRDFVRVPQLRGMAILGMTMHAEMPATRVFLPLFIIESLGMDYTYVGLALFINGSMHLLQFIWGGISDRVGRGRMIVAGTLLWGVIWVAVSLVHGYTLLVTLLFIGGIGTSMWNVTAWSLMSDIGEKLKKEGEVVGTYMSIAKIGAFASFMVSGLIVMRFGIPTLFAIIGLVIIAGSLVSYPLLVRKY